MYNPASFAENRTDVLDAFIRAYPLGTIVNTGPNGLEASQVPMILDRPDGSGAVLRCHIARANPQWRTLTPDASVLTIFHGPSHYISPSWYPAKQEHGKVVPTWNYATVHVWGTVRLFEERDELKRHVRELTEQHEALFENPWSIDDAPVDYVDGMTKAIVGLEIRIERMEGKWKASQNRSLEDQEAVVRGLEKIDSPGSLEMANVMRTIQRGKR